MKEEERNKSKTKGFYSKRKIKRWKERKRYLINKETIET